MLFLFGPFNVILLFTLTHYILLFLETKEGVESESISTDGIWLCTGSSNNTALFASLITQTATDIETLIDSLPDQEYTPEKQVIIMQLVVGATRPSYFCIAILCELTKF